MICAENILQRETSDTTTTAGGGSVVGGVGGRVTRNPPENNTYTYTYNMTLLFLFYFLFSKGAARAVARRGSCARGGGGEFHIGGHAIPSSAAGHHPPVRRPSPCGRGVLVGAFTTNPTDRPAAPATIPVFVISSRATLEPRGTLQLTRRRATRDEHVVRTDYVFLTFCCFYILSRAPSHVTPESTSARVSSRRIISDSPRSRRSRHLGVPGSQQ